MAPAPLRHVFVVAADRHALHARLARMFADLDTVEVVLDRRAGERRAADRPVIPERRRGERRGNPHVELELLADEFAIVTRG
jgi:hypothetical protein